MDIEKTRSRRLNRQAWTLGACLTFCFGSGALAIPNSSFDQGIDLYNRGSYDKSLEYLMKAEIASPSDPLVHYYLASAYARLGKHKEAKQEYFACYCLDPKGPTSEYCKKALRIYGEPVPGDIGKPKSAGDEQIDRAVSQIKRQAALQKQSKNDLANQGSLTAGRVGEEEALRIKGAAYRRLNNRPSYLVPGDFFNRDTEDPNVVLARAEEGARLARMSAKQRAEEYEKWKKAQEKDADEVAGNLESQLKSSSVKGGARLRPEGTGFYVRFYGQERNGPLPNTHGSVARLEPFVPGDSQVPETKRTKSVKGDIVH